LLISNLLPHDVIVVQQIGAFHGFISAEEQEALGSTVPKRRLEFTAGRTCARRALQLLGVTPSPLLRGLSREPLWPSGIVGSITHCDGYCAAAVAFTDRYSGIGIDAETNGPLAKGILETISLREERERLDMLPRTDLCWDRLLFSIKEAVYKVWYPVAKSWLGFEDACVTIDPDRGTFEVKLLRKHTGLNARVLSELSGHYIMEGKHILTAIVLRR
jgi:4'-phosphopantetheinyl transferase EntD